MASFVELVPNKKYKLFVELESNPDGSRNRRTKVVKANGKREARKLLSKFEQEIIENSHLSIDNPFMPAFIDRWRKNYAQTELDVATLESYNISLKQIERYFKKKKIKAIKPLHIIEFYTSERNAGRGSLETKHKVLQSLFKHAVIWKYIDKEDNPMEDVAKPKTKRKQHKDFYNKHELKILFEMLGEQPEHQQLIAKCALYGGLRRGEVLGIADDAIDFESNKITVMRSLQCTKSKGFVLKETKGRDSRIVIFPDKFMQELYRYYKRRLQIKKDMGKLWTGFLDQNQKDIFLLFGNEYGNPFRPDSVSQFWDRFMNRNKDKIKRIRFHDLRHSSASLILSEGVNMKIVQKRLGHKDIRTTLNMYSHITTEDEQKASDVFNDFF
ncbi:tyrosine-type recombinase/integrase [Virgibacillus sp. 179-BFC.A HS]|uniref:Tyrosine-type recombinase/integrase n=1 Tax=Tigheibacillus jepli TaxID=3035914 RepID=A0ABU5CLL9_9BACI|nr:tyrosine-type recombinase/integrase [Virgibacillus sp. 179-BFC.A HS]MDY0407235.1 tyrosine-type recombinase/integrase [Virgibacillus sp. 179-BFC.A HS]